MGDTRSGTERPRLRTATAADLPAAFAVFRRSLFDYLHRIGMVTAEEAANPQIDEPWSRQRHWIEHLSATAAESWVAEDAAGRVIGWALSVERDGVLELTHFFVEPGVQAAGLGRALLDRAFPRDRGRHRVIIATQDPAAVSLYLRSGVGHVATSVELARRPEPRSVETDLALERLAPGDVAVTAIGDLEARLLGHRRDLDIAFLLRHRPAWLARRAGEPVGFAFGAEGADTGPIAALDAGDLPALLDLVESDAAQRGLDSLSFVVPMTNRVALGHLLARRFRIDPFYVMVLGDESTMALDRWVHTGPEFIL